MKTIKAPFSIPAFTQVFDSSGELVKSDDGKGYLAKPTAAPLAAYRVHRSDGASYLCDMAHGVTLKQARSYFIGSVQYLDDDETRSATVTDVTNV
jgi:hypothetical protein